MSTSYKISSPNGVDIIGNTNISGSLFGTSSWAENSLTASFAPNYVLNSQTSSMIVLSSSYAATASLAPNYVLNSATSSFVLNSQTSSFVQNSQTSSFVTNSQTSSFVQNSQTSSMTVLSSSYALTASYAMNGGGGGVTQIIAGSNISISPTSGTGSVTISSTGGGGVSKGFVIAMAASL